MPNAFQQTFSTEFVLASTGASAGLGFGFTAALIRVSNESGVPIHYSFASTVASNASTNDASLQAGIWDDFYLQANGMTVMTTSTTTSTGNDGIWVRVSAYAMG